MNRRIILTLNASLALLTTSLSAADFVKGYTIGTGSPLLASNGGAGDFLIVDQAATGGDDLSADAGNPVWGWRIPNINNWLVGDKVKFTGLAVPVWASDPDTDASNNTQNAVWRIRFYSGGPDGIWQGANNIGTSDDSLIGYVDVNFTLADSGVDQFHANFDAPLVWDNADSTTIYFYIQALGNKAMRLKSGTPGAVAQIAHRQTGANLSVSGATTTRFSVAASIESTVWHGDGDAIGSPGIANWDESSPNWNGGTVAYSPGDRVLFDETFDGNSSEVNLVAALAPGPVTVSHTSGGSVPEYVFSGTGGLGGAMSLTRKGTGTLTLNNTGTNDFTGGTFVRAGTLKLGRADALPTAGSVTIGDANTTAALVLNGHNQTLGGIINGGSGSGFRRIYNGSTTAATLTLNVGTGADLNYNHTLGFADDADGNNFSLVKTGSGTQRLGVNSYLGTTSVNAGTLLINGSAAAATGAITVAEGATLGGTGTLGGAITVESGATLAPGVAVGVLTAINSVTLEGNSTFSVQINSGTATADQLSVSGPSLDLGTTAQLQITDIAVTPAELAGGTVIYIINYVGSTLTGTFSGLPEGGTITVGPNTFAIQYNDVSRVALTVVGGGDAFADWVADKELSAPDNTFTTDAEKDGITNGIEFVLGGDPKVSDPEILPTATSTQSDLVFVFRLAKNAEYLAPTVEYGSDLTGWTTAVDGEDGVTIEIEPDGVALGLARITVTIPLALSSGDKLFARLAVSDEALGTL